MCCNFINFNLHFILITLRFMRCNILYYNYFVYKVQPQLIVDHIFLRKRDELRMKIMARINCFDEFTFVILEF